MRVETKLDQPSPLDPPQELSKEMSFARAMRHAVEDLFTCQQVADALVGHENDLEVEHFVQSWKGMLSAELEESGQVYIEGFLDALLRFQIQREENMGSVQSQQIYPETPTT